MGARGPKRGSLKPENKNILAHPHFLAKRKKEEDRGTARKKEELAKLRGERSAHFKTLTKQQIGLVIDYITTGNKTEATQRNYDIQPHLANKFAYFCLNKPKVKEAIKAELKFLDAEISEDYIARGLFELESMAKTGKDLGALKGAYDLMMKLKGLGSSKVITETTVKNSFEQKAPEEIREALIDTIKACSEKGLIDYTEFKKDLDRSMKNNRAVKKIEESTVTEV